MAGKWVVGQVKSNAEQYAADNIARQGFDYYLPMTAELIAFGKQHVVVGRPLFKGYIFVDVEHRRWQSLLSTRGLWGLIGVSQNQAHPSMLPDGAVEEMRRREDAEGLVRLPQRLVYHKGQQVRITSGHFKERKGIYQGMSTKERVEILLDYLGRKTSVLIAQDLIEAI